ncbi:(Dimethylallyl)adenosine tRNA methylthiotransferase miaB [Desulfurobacterium thermolithotrophum DSM 11699]|uniref:tRNA-2-methylthio-N(6)-dimethylallyladenosine synthase n=1 Tax=Desulfurobacterium thermolithotrophum (strain DSM 11699 / BSA) TaxID=868864 RepID=F0S013_DESTD|nr:tRNA (N6-isopentenyl adenosine(37)-C2)-methylthiotransferase MiaB [Desulfurobacterium thermolithotrophum]ADY73694.1 (Dimethylallyl)adenosine tRNA methylthiotransferase miaB [Desulfurobacterium thermolithotrophum DSM 11699]
MKKFYIKTFGCQMNVNDSEKMAGILRSLGYEKTDLPEEADLIIVNTCSVRAKPDNKAYSFIGNLKKIKKEKPETIIAVGGCVPQKEKESILRFKHVDLVFGTFNFMKIGELIKRAKKERVVEILNSKIPEEDKVPLIDSYLENPYVAYVTVQRGCNRFCSYCIVPFTRGRERSVKPELVLKEVKRLAERGVKEVHLLGQNVDFYNYEGIDLADLLYMVSEVEGIERIRFTTSHPCGFNRKIVEAMKNIEKVCPYVHLPPQSGSTKILERMNRGYTREEYTEKVMMLKEEIPKVALSGDFIVGFPGETTKDFEETLSLVETCVFDQGFVFEYSPRPFTKASNFKDDVPKEEKNRRLQELQNLLRVQAEEKNKKRLGCIEEVLVEGKSPKGKELSGRTKDNKLVVFDGSEELVGKFVEIEITETSPFFLKGKLLQKVKV